MKVINSLVSESFREKGSRFTGYLFPASSVDAFEKQLNRITSEHPRATHHCYAWRIDPNDLQEYVQDDGEPAGTAGKPILNQLKSRDLVNAGLVVVRYFGGTELGKTGLIEAYSHTAGLCLEKCTTRQIVPSVNVRVTYPYQQENRIDQLKANYRLSELDAEYLQEVTLTVGCPAELSKELIDELQQMEHLEIQYKVVGQSYLTKKG